MPVQVILFYSASGDYNFCTNFYPHPFTIKDQRFLTSEHYYQVMKFRYKGASEKSLEYSRIIQACDTPNKTKVLGHQKPHYLGGNWQVNKSDKRKLNDIIKEYSDVKMHPFWDHTNPSAEGLGRLANQTKIRVMFKALKAKFQDETLRKRLISVPDNTYFVEHTNRDTIWADGGDKGTGKFGLNYLGKLLTILSHLLKHGGLEKISDELAERLDLENTVKMIQKTKKLIK